MSDEPVVTPTANPPIVIGPFTNVPAPGSPIGSDWPQSASNWMANAMRLYKDGAIVAAASDRLMVIGGNVVINTDASGTGRYDFPTAFAATPVGVAHNGDPAQNFLIAGHTMTAASMTILARIAASGAAAAGAVRVWFVCIGPRP